MSRKSAASDEGALLLLGGLKSLLRCDGAEVVEGIARFVTSQHASLRAGSSLMRKARGTPLPLAAALLGGLNRFLEVRPGDDGAGTVWVARLSNERRVLEALPGMVPELKWAKWKFRRVPRVAALAALPSFVASAPALVGAARRLHRRHEFFKVLRAAELVGYYVRYLGLFRRGRYRLALMSSHSNPHGIAFNLAARRCGVPVVLVTHGMPVRPVAQLRLDLSIVHCEAARRIYTEEDCGLGRVFTHGRKGLHAPMPAGPMGESLAVGIFLCKDVNEERLRALVAGLLKGGCVARVLVRPHPKNLWRGLGEWVASAREPRLGLGSGGTVSRDLEAVDIVLAGNSSVLVDAVTAGRPAAFVSRLDYAAEDMHGFVRNGLIYPLNGVPDIYFDALLDFYRRPEWPDVLRLFANVDEDERAVAARFASAVRELAAPVGKLAPP